MDYVTYVALHFAAQFAFLVLAMQIGGKAIQIDFGRLRPALLKALLLTAILAAFWFFVSPHLASPVSRGVILGVICWLSVTFILPLDRTEVWLFTPIVYAGSWLTFIIVNVAILDLLAAR